MPVTEAEGSLWGGGTAAVETVELRRTSTLRDVVRSAVADGLNQLLRFAPGVCRADEPEDVHRSRVATRKMRSQLKSFSVAVEANWLGEIRSELGWLAGGLGAVRDSDVMIARIRRCATELTDEDREWAAMLTHRLVAARDENARAAAAMLESPRCRSLIERLGAAAADPPVLPIASERASDLAAPIVSAAWRRLDRSVSALPAHPGDDDLHEVRIRAKRCRYTAEILVPVMGDRYRRLSKSLAELQGVLGDIHDSHCTQIWLRGSVGSPREALTAGMIIAAESRDHAALLGSWRDAWLTAHKARPR